MKWHEEFLNEAFNAAFQSLSENAGGPFGAVVVKDGKIIAKGGNQVVSRNDPTAHAEIVAIREACRKLNTFDLAGSVLYATCEPCPMCLSAIYWANIDTVYYSSTRHDAAGIGFRDSHIYEELDKVPDDRRLEFRQIAHPRAAELLTTWKTKFDKIPY
jgi:guanine deaminase